MIIKLLTYLLNLLQPKNNEVVVYLWEFTKEQVTKEDTKIYLEWKDVLWIELKFIKNRLLSLYQAVRKCKTADERLDIQSRIDEQYKAFNRLNIIVNPELYMKKDTK